MKSMATRGILIGWLTFLVIAMIAYVTPARVPVLMVAGRDYAVLRLQLQVRQQAVETLQPHGSALNRAQDRGPTLARARTGTSDVEARMQDWRRLNATISPFGFISWLSDLWPWLVGLAFALPVLGGLIGAQIPRQKLGPSGVEGAKGKRQKEEQSDEKKDGQDSGMWGVRHPPVPEPTRAKDPGRTAVVPNPNPLPEPIKEPTPETSETSETARATDPSAWNWSARPAVRTTPARPKMPPVKSPHGEKSEE